MVSNETQSERENEMDTTKKAIPEGKTTKAEIESLGFVLLSESAKGWIYRHPETRQIVKLSPHGFASEIGG